MSYPSLTFRTELPEVIRKELEHLVAQIEGFLSAAGFNADGSFSQLIANQITVVQNPEVGGNGSVAVNGGSLCVQNGNLCVKDENGNVVFRVDTSGRIYKWLGTYKQKVGTFTGNGTGQSIALEFNPDAVLVFPADGTVSSNWGGGCFRTKDMPAGQSVVVGGGPQEVATGITSLDGSGFTVGTDVSCNENTKSYVYIAIADKAGAIFRTGTHTGDGVDDRSITIDSAGFRPVFMMLYSGQTGGAGGGSVKHTEMAVDYSVDANENVNTGNKIQKFESTGFELGSEDSVNRSGTVYYWMAWRKDAANALAGLLKRGSFAGTGASQVITGVGFAPELVRVLVPSVFGSNWRHTTEHAGNDSSRIRNGSIETDRITAMGSDGFTVDTDLSQSGITSWYEAWKTGEIEALVEVFDPAELFGAISVEDGSVSLSLGIISNEHVAADAGIVLSKLQDIATNRILGRTTAGDGEIEQLQVNSTLALASGVLGRAAITGDVTVAAGSNTATISNDTVTYAQMQNVSAASRLLGRGSAAGAGDPEELTVSGRLGISGTDLAITGHYEAMTDGDTSQPELLFANGEVVYSLVSE